MFGNTTVQDSWAKPWNFRKIKNNIKSENLGNIGNFYLDLKRKFKDSKRNNLFIFDYFWCRLIPILNLKIHAFVNFNFMLCFSFV
jgi:hypothetical protein